MTKREQLVAKYLLENMTFEGFCFIVEKEVNEKIHQRQMSEIRRFYDLGLNTFSDVVRHYIWENYGRVIPDEINQ